MLPAGQAAPVPAETAVRSAAPAPDALAAGAGPSGRSAVFLFPLQFDSDSQVRRYSPFGGMKEAIARVMTSFARDAPMETHLVIRNYPLGSGLIRYDRFIRSFSEACGIEDRGLFVESGSSAAMLCKSRAVVRLNSAWACRRWNRARPCPAWGVPFMLCSGWPGVRRSAAVRGSGRRAAGRAPHCTALA